MEKDLQEQIAKLSAKLDRLAAESEIRCIISRYMLLCDTPLPEGDMAPEQRIELIVGRCHVVRGLTVDG
ncbi:hypothetical protein [Rhizobium sp.]|uniref:hypothetical protein n=1 Tax=Rhizobium sp. TaxID=391 RepID=UPI0028AC103F